MIVTQPAILIALGMMFAFMAGLGYVSIHDALRHGE